MTEVATSGLGGEGEAKDRARDGAVPARRSLDIRGIDPRPPSAGIFGQAVEVRPLDGLGDRWVRWLGASSVVCAIAATLVALVSLADLFDEFTVRFATLMLVSLAGLAGLAGLAAWRVRTMLLGRLDLFGQALNATSDALVIVSPKGTVSYANSAFRQLFPDGLNRPIEAIGEAVGADGRYAADFARLRAQATGGGRALAQLPIGSGWFAVAVHPIGGRKGYSFWSLQDITARYEMEQVIRDEQDKLVDFLDNAPIGFYSVDEAGRFLLVNRTLAEWLGRESKDIVEAGARLHEFVVDPPAGVRAYNPFDATGEQAQRGEVTLRGGDGREVQALISQTVVQGPDGLRTRSVVRDLSPEREYEEALRKSRQRFQRFFENAPVGVALLDRAGRLQEVNRALGDLLSVTPQDLVLERLIDFVHKDESSGVADKLRTIAAGTAGAASIEVRLKGVREKTVVLFISRLDAADGSDGGLILHFIDSTEQKSLQAQFAQSQKMQAIGQLAGGVAHDFNNLLTAMIGFCDLLLLRFRPGDPSFADIMQIKQNANRAANLVRQLLAFSRQQTLQPRVLNITDVLAELSHLLRRLIGENIELKMVHGRELGPVKVDQGQLEQVIINLAVNARDAMSGGGTLSIRTGNLTLKFDERRAHETIPAGDYVLIETTDTGVGIPKENLQRIFEPFFSTKEIGSGTGLGLSTVYGIVKQTGGFIFVDSEPARGAAFSILLPRHHSAAESVTTKVETVDRVGIDLTGDGTILLVEDEDPVRLFSARALRNKGYTVVEAKSGEAALEIIQRGEHKIDLLITDVVMPRLDGPGLIRHVREIDATMKVIFISGYAEDNFRKRLDSDADIHFLAKPFSLKQLATKVKEVISVN